MNLDEAAGGFDVFRRRATTTEGATDPEWRIGFDAEFRSGFEPHIVRDIVDKLGLATPPVPAPGAFLVDIGAGASRLTESLTDWTTQNGLAHVAVDAPEMLDHLPGRAGRLHVAGRFPDCAPGITTAAPAARYYLAYSVLQYVVRDGLLDVFVDTLMHLMQPGSVALLGDIPNRDTRARQRASVGTVRSDTDDDTSATVRDAHVLRVVSRARAADIHCYLLPQPSKLALALHREDLLLVRPGPYPPPREEPQRCPSHS